jgi:competence protein ComEC
LPGKETGAFQSFIFSLRSYIVQTIKKYIHGSNQETGIAEALLIGYKEDLDKDLVQAYSNAGVVHIIAISGLHLGLIYVMLTKLLNWIPLIRKNKFIKMLLLLGCLWIFSLLTGASASVLRSAVMFTFIVVGKNYFTQSSVYNSLAASAFLLLCYDPYFLWDVGFQLSYLALIGIVGLQQPLNRLLYCKQSWLEKIWSMFTVTLAAQISAFPICLYYFHQFPNLFFITNMLAVPLSTIILFAEIFLIAVSGLNFIAVYTGQLTGFMIRIMNKIITGLNSFPYSVWDNIYANIYTTWALYLFVFGLCGWLIYKSNIAFRIAIFSLFFYTSFHVLAYLKVRKQVSMIVYNIPKCRAIDFIYRR